MCHCVDVEFGSYKNTVSMKTPEGKWVCIDTCLATEIGWLWHKGIKTLNSCCGHNKIHGSIVVDPTSISAMEALGYKHDTTPNYQGRQDIFMAVGSVDLLAL